MPLDVDQLSFTLGGIPFGDVDEFGCDWSIEKFTGWGSTTPSGKISQRARSSGGWRSSSFAAARTVSASGKIYAPSADALTAAFDRLNASIPPGEDRTLVVSEAGLQRSVVVQQDDDVLTDWELSTIGTWSIQVASTDWRKFGGSLSGHTGLPSVAGGLTIPFTIPFTINSTVVSGQVSLTNPGNTDGPLLLRIDGPCYGPVIADSFGGSLSFPGLTLGAGEFLVIDPEKKTALAQGTANRANYIGSRVWPRFRPGSNTYSFTAANYNAASLLTVTGTPAWR